MKLKDVLPFLVSDIEVMHIFGDYDSDSNSFKFRNYEDVFDFKVDKFNLDDPMQFDDCIKVYGNKKLNSLIGDDDSIFITVI